MSLLHTKEAGVFILSIFLILKNTLRPLQIETELLPLFYTNTIRSRGCVQAHGKGLRFHLQAVGGPGAS